MNDFSTDVKLARGGDSEAFARLYSLVYKDLYHIALYSLRSSHDACDVVSDTVLDAFTTIGRLKDEKAFRGWIMKILSAKIKRKQREYFANTAELKDEELPEEEFGYENVELREAVGRLDPQSRLILSMSALEGYTGDEIAQICGMNAATVRSRLSRIKERLRLELSGT
ncbi:RNA polymerase sigma-70 factor, ECF subfamily [Ruminococcus sp. YRD2003]|uniref:RNA polymerase sigma factor n=1 Tax=Ruminococcus sp. YRD2003 TaxID=1452313 RepID=UPI0008C90071|nr:sigma-70 family RNA polymerase sigma factor [Ruminococcus sp.]SEK84890.1 RNA polymerase sigma-70 factor, ECF subfamily [Ruminococcus flavefaciens]